jgi:hypothetical protein
MMRPPTAAPAKKTKRAVIERVKDTCGTPQMQECKKNDVSGHVCCEYVPERQVAHGIDKTGNGCHPKQRIWED